MNKYILYDKQLQAIHFKGTQFMFLGGVGCGKTVTGAHFMLEDIITRPTIKKVIFSNTQQQLTKSTLHVFMDVLASYEFLEGYAYVINKNPKKYFGYDGMYSDYHGVWSFKNGAQVLTYSLDQQIRGTSFGTAWGDEIQAAKKERIDMVMGRMREPNPKTLYTLTPPYGNPDVNEWVFSGKVPMVVATSFENKDNLPQEYFDLISTWDPLTFDREVMAREAKNVSNRFAHQFTDLHINAEADYVEGKPVYLSFDFNINPGTCVAWQQGYDSDGKEYIHYFDEIVVADANVYKMCDRVKAKFANDYLMVTGDKTSMKGEFVTRQNAQNTWSIIRQELRLTGPQIHLINNPTTERVMILVNSMLARHPQIFFHPRMKNTIYDLRFVQVDEYNKIKKKDRSKPEQQADLLDCVKYSMWTFHRDFVHRYRNDYATAS